MSENDNNFESTNIRVLEDWGLMLLEPSQVDTEIFDSEEELYVSSIKYKDLSEATGHSGVYRIVCQKDFMNMLAENILGLGDDVSEEDAKDAIKEMANVVCGNLLTELYGNEHAFELTPPELSTLSEISLEGFQPEKSCAFLADDCPVLVTLHEER